MRKLTLAIRGQRIYLSLRIVDNAETIIMKSITEVAFKDGFEGIYKKIHPFCAQNKLFKQMLSVLINS